MLKINFWFLHFRVTAHFLFSIVFPSSIFEIFKGHHHSRHTPSKPVCFFFFSHFQNWRRKKLKFKCTTVTRNMAARYLKFSNNLTKRFQPFKGSRICPAIVSRDEPHYIFLQESFQQARRSYSSLAPSKIYFKQAYIVYWTIFSVQYNKWTN